MKKLLLTSLFVVLSLTLALVLRQFFPKYSGMLIFFFSFLLFDGYLWISVRRSLKKFGPLIRGLAVALFWLPVALLFFLMVFGYFIPFLKWNMPVRTYLQSFILTLFLTLIFPILTLILADIIRIIKFFIRLAIHGMTSAKLSISRFKPLLIAGWLLGAVVFLSMTAGTLFWQFDFNLHKEVITLEDLPPAFEGFKIVQFSDVHLGSWGVRERLEEAMDDINSLQPDVIFFTGDMFNYYTADGDGFQDILKTLHAPWGIYAILGNHDYGDYITWSSVDAKRRNMEDLITYYNDLGWKLLRNSNDILKKGADSIAVIGVENWGATRRFQRFGDVDIAQRGTETMAIQLLLSHDPSHWDSIVSKKHQNIDVTFSGHTHGGQVGIDFCGLHWSPVKWVSRLWCGIYKNPASETPQYLYVNQGLGNIGYSGRIGILPEITLITLKRASD
ncbi:MAG: metallophosphoesterase [Bacteroidales bacterium]|nr:metallophosphoesterase [Bacteroidales bacterium]